MKINQIISATLGNTGEVFLVLDITDEGVSETLTHVYRADDPYAGATGLELRNWLAENSDKITPYTAPAPPTIDEVRARMPALTSRQFWMAAANIDIDKDVIIAKIKSALADSIDRKMMIAELESR